MSELPIIKLTKIQKRKEAVGTNMIVVNLTFYERFLLIYQIASWVMATKTVDTTVFQKI